MKRTLTVLAAILAATAATASASAAVSCQQPTDAVYYGTSHGYASFLTGIGTSWWSGKTRLPTAAVLAGLGDDPTLQVPRGPVRACGTGELAVTANAVTANQSRFFALVRAFPPRPTRKQWGLRLPALINAGVKTDAAIVSLLKIANDAHLAEFNSSHNCGVPPNPPHVCDDGTLYDGGLGISSMGVMADRVALTRLLSTPYPAS